MTIMGLGGIFLKADNPEALRDWYRNVLDINFEGGLAAILPANGEGEPRAYGVFGLFPSDTSYFKPSDAPFMINFRVDDLEATLADLRAKGVVILGEPETHPQGSFAWIQDPEGIKIELWQPVR